jgi:eight-cysteine-cluster-containing protein
MKFILLIVATFMIFGCLAPQPEENPIDSINSTFTAEKAKCGSEILPKRNDMEGGVFLEGSIGASNPCYDVNHTFEMEDGTVVLNIETIKQDVDSCVKCIGTIPWKASILGYTGKVNVTYNDKQVFPKEGFCGWETKGWCKSDFDCVAGGCSGQVCESTHENAVRTTCEYNECYDAQAYGVRCGCVQGLCQWR